MKVNKKCVRVWGKLNQNTKVRVRCGGGYSQWQEVGDTLGQGSGGAALASQANLDRGITTIFKGSSDLVVYGTVPISPLLFQDDIFFPFWYNKCSKFITSQGRYSDENEATDPQ